MGVPGAEVKVLPEISDGSKKKKQKQKNIICWKQVVIDAIVQKTFTNRNKVHCD